MIYVIFGSPLQISSSQTRFRVLHEQIVRIFGHPQGGQPFTPSKTTVYPLQNNREKNNKRLSPEGLYARLICYITTSLSPETSSILYFQPNSVCGLLFIMIIRLSYAGQHFHDFHRHTIDRLHTATDTAFGRRRFLPPRRFLPRPFPNWHALTHSHNANCRHQLVITNARALHYLVSTTGLMPLRSNLNSFGIVSMEHPLYS